MLTQDKCSDTFWARGWVWGKTNTTHATSQKPTCSPIYSVLHRVFIFHICISKSTLFHIIDDVPLSLQCGGIEVGSWEDGSPGKLFCHLQHISLNEKDMCLTIRWHGMTNFRAINWINWLQHIWALTSRRRPPKYAICSGVSLCRPFQTINGCCGRFVCFGPMQHWSHCIGLSLFSNTMLKPCNKCIPSVFYSTIHVAVLTLTLSTLCSPEFDKNYLMKCCWMSFFLHFFHGVLANLSSFY